MFTPEEFEAYATAAQQAVSAVMNRGPVHHWSQEGNSVIDIAAIAIGVQEFDVDEQLNVTLAPSRYGLFDPMNPPKPRVLIGQHAADFLAYVGYKAPVPTIQE